MRYLYALIALLLGLVLLGLGIGQLSADNEETRTAEIESAEDAPFTVVTDDIIDVEADRDEFTIQAEGEYNIAMGRIFDIEAWLDDTAHNLVTGFVEGEGDEASSIEIEHIDGESEAPNPEASDLWVATESAEGDLLYRWNAPDNTGDWALMLFRDGEEAAPVDITIEETQTLSQVSGVVLTIPGAVLILISLGLFYWVLKSRRAGKDTDDDHPEENSEDEEPMSDPIHDRSTSRNAQDSVDDALEGEGRTEFSSGARRALSMLVATTFAAASAVGIAGPAHADDQGVEDEPDVEDDLDTEDDPEIESEEEPPAEGYSVLLDSQLERILEEISDTVETADEEQDAELLEDRVAADALEVRELAYRNNDLADSSLPDPIGTDVLSAAVTAEPDFPRKAMMITEHPDGEVPQVLVLQQSSPRENYQLIHASSMAPGTEFPSLSPEEGGVSPLDPEDEVDGLSPMEAIEETAEYFTDSDHDFGDMLGESAYVESLHDYYDDFTDSVEDTEVSFPSPSTRDDLTALALPDDSTVVAGSFERVTRMAPLEDGDTIFLEDDLVVELVDTDWTTFPTEIHQLESVVLHLPAPDSDEDVVLLGVHEIVEDASIETPEGFDE